MKSRTAPAEQIAALPIDRDDHGRLRVLMITSRDTGRWVVPKGWPMKGRKPWQAAGIEALEEAGVEGDVGTEPLGTYTYDKITEDGSALPCRVTVYPMRVARLRKRWKERAERERRWFKPKAAARRVDEPDLRDLIKALRRR